MPPKKKQQRCKIQNITLRDVVNHMSAMEQRLSGGIDKNTKGIEANTKGIAENTKAIHALTDLDTVRIRKHVGMPVSSED